MGKGTSDVGPIHGPVVSNSCSVHVVRGSKAEDTAAAFPGPSEFSDHRRLQPMRQATLLRMPIVDSNIEHQVVFPQGSSSNKSSNSSNNDNNNNDSASSSSSKNDDFDDADLYMSDGSTVSADWSNSPSSSHDNPHPRDPNYIQYF